MAISDRMLTAAELQAIIDLRTAMKAIPNGPASGWTGTHAHERRHLGGNHANIVL